MPSEQRAVLERILELTNAGDPFAALECYQPDAAWITRASYLSPAIHRGHDEIRAFWQEYLDAVELTRWDATDLEERGDKLYVAMRWRGRGRHSGAPIEQVLQMVFTFREGKVERVQAFDDREAALRALEES
jgi:ketosteroid isomerase-like protein